MMTSMQQTVLLSLMAGMSYDRESPVVEMLKAADYKEDYDLIMRKESKLSANERRHIVAKYEKLRRGLRS